MATTHFRPLFQLPFWLVVLAILAVATVQAQQVEDVVYLKDGSIIHGVIIEQRPGESILIRTHDGNQFRYSLDKIERMTKETQVTRAARSTAAAPVGHTGFHAAVGLGYGSAGVNCSGCTETRNSSTTAMFRFGGAVAHSVVLSGEFSSWSLTKNGGTFTFSWLNVVAQYYPDPAEGWYLKAGVGLGTVQATAFVTGFGNAKLETSNSGLVLGVGYDIRFSRGFSLTPFADYLYALPANAKVNGASAGVSVGANVIHTGVAASWR